MDAESCRQGPILSNLAPTATRPMSVTSFVQYVGSLDSQLAFNREVIMLKDRKRSDDPSQRYVVLSGDAKKLRDTAGLQLRLFLPTWIFSGSQSVQRTVLDAVREYMLPGVSV
jgi:hypothetical protein